MQHLIPEIIVHIVQQTPDIDVSDILKVTEFAGFTNKNYLVETATGRYVFRASGENATALKINREQEYQILKAVDKADIGAHVTHMVLPTGHLVTQFIDGKHLSLDEYRSTETLTRIVDTLKKLHSLPRIQVIFCPFERIKEFVQTAIRYEVSFPDDFHSFTAKTKAIQRQQLSDTSDWKRFCHNDLFSVNVIDDGQNIRFIDWEFAGMGDLYFDLATLCYAYDSPDTLSTDLQHHLLDSYFGNVTVHHWERLNGMKYMLMFFSAMWGLAQHGMENHGIIEEVVGFDYLEYAEETFQQMRILFSL